MSDTYTPEKIKELGDKALPKGNVLYPPQIINRFLSEQGAQPKQVEAFIINTAQAIKEGKAKLLQFGNTVFIITPKPDKSIEFVTMTVEPEMVAMRLTLLPNALKEMGFRKAYTIVTSDKAAKIADQSGIQFKKINTKMNEKPAIRYEIDL
jgi:hypothetical protein